MFLVGWEVNIQFGQEQEHDQTEKGLDNQPEGGGMYYNVVFIIFLIMLLSLLCCYCLLLVYSKYEKIFSHFNRRLLKLFIHFES